MEKERTKMHQNAPNEALDKQKAEAMEMKFQCKKYGEISTKLGISLDTVKKWFQTDGVLYEAYLRYKQQRLSVMEQDSLLLLKREVWNAVAVLNQALREESDIQLTCPECKHKFIKKIQITTNNRLRASKEVLDRVYGKPQYGLKISNSFQTSDYSNLTDEELERQIREAKREKMSSHK